MFKFFTNLFKKRPKKYDNIHQAVDEVDNLYPELNNEIEAKEPFMSVEVEEGDRLEDITRKWEEKYPQAPIDDMPSSETSVADFDEGDLSPIEFTSNTGAVNKKRRKKHGGWKYIRIHSNFNAFTLHLSELQGRGAEIIVDGMKVTWWYD